MITRSTHRQPARRTSTWLLAAMFAGSTLAACGYSEDEMQAKNKEIENLRNQLSAEQSQNKKAKSETRREHGPIDKASSRPLAWTSPTSTPTWSSRRARSRTTSAAPSSSRPSRSAELLRAKLQSLTKLGLNVTVRNNRMVIQLPGDVLFDTGKETLKKEGTDILGKVGDVIRGDAGPTRTFQVAGHTDNQPLSGGRFKDNWGLSVMRARGAGLSRRRLDKGGRLPPKNWAAPATATDPVKPNTRP
ncbi:MAG: hypothetical protein WKG00_08210 [Polyangiaceae bacterium]